MWELKTVSDRDWRQDDSGVYVLINWRRKEHDCRLDVMSDADEPIVSFVGPSDAVRKAFCDWCEETSTAVSLEHASYIGRELSKAGRLGEDYVQD